ncbi:MAG: nitroreductase family protein [Caldilineaceae bacterium]|nr:nitroreductase family protein [Caldilineaceae bacterium]
MGSELQQKAIAAKRAQTNYPIHPLLRDRWSPRAFANKPVEDAKLQSVLEAARWSASGGNLQPWAFLLARRDQDAASFARMAECLGESNAIWAAQAPILGITVASLYRRPEVLNRHSFHDVGLAVQNLIIQATALELYVHMMGGFSPDKARELFAIPAEYEAVTMFAMGYLGDPEGLADRHREGELSARTRRPLAEFVFTEGWGIPSPLVKAE